MRRAAIALLAAIIGGVVVGFAPMATPAGAATCQAGAQQVAVVVDFGDGATVTSTCVGLAARATGYDALTERASELGTAAPRVENGLVCGIDGYPATGCAEQNGATYSYWSYWKGSGSWIYSGIGAQSRVRPEVVEGWRYVTRGQEGAVPPPNGSPTASDTCSAAPADTTPATEAPTTAPPGTSGDAPGADPAAAPSSTAPTATSSSTADTTTTTSSSAGTSSSSGEVAAPVVTVSAQDDPDKGGGSPLGLVAGVAVVGALGVGGALFVRRRGSIG